MLQADRQIALHQLLQRHTGVLLPAADRHLLIAVGVDTHVEGQHQPFRAKAFEPAFHFLRGFHRGGADHHAGDAGLKQGRDIRFGPHAAADLHRDVNPGDQRFQQRDLALRRILRPGQVDQVQDFRPLSGIGLQARQRIAAIVALLAVIALMETNDGAVD